MSRLINEIINKPDWEKKIDDPAIVERWEVEVKKQGLDPVILLRILDLLRIYRNTKDTEYDEYDGTYPWPLELEMDMSMFTEDCANCLCPYCNGENEYYDSDVSEGDFSDSEDLEEAREAKRMECLCEKTVNIKKRNWLHSFLSVRPSQISDELCEALKEGTRRLERGEPDWHPGSKQQVRDLVHPSLFCYVKGVSPLGEDPATVATEIIIQSTESESKNNESETKVIAPTLPLDKTKTDVVFKWLPADFTVQRTEDEDGHTKYAVNFETYINNLDRDMYPELYQVIGGIMGRFIPMFRRVLLACQHKDRIKDLPEYDSDNTASFFENGGQVIVKMANIELTPDNPKYPGGSWHLEGLAEEEIVATGIYYYDLENVTDSFLEFRSSTNHEAIEYSQGQYRYVDMHYPVEDYTGEDQFDADKSTAVYLDKVKTEEDLCLVFPNFLQHHVPGFSLRDKTRPGHRKILVFFLIHPGHRVLSTKHVPEQQSMMKLEDAKIYRELLMFQRKYKVDDQNNFFERSFSLCEH